MGFGWVVGVVLLGFCCVLAGAWLRFGWRFAGVWAGVLLESG